MFNNVVLDVAIGLIFVFLLYSLLASIVQEIIATKLAFRAKILEKGILRMLEDGKTGNRLKSIGHIWARRNVLKNKKIAAWFYAHPLIKYLGENNTYSKPSYLSAQNFSQVMLDLLKGACEDGTSEAQQINEAIRKGVIYHLPIDLASDKYNPAIKAIRYQLGANYENGKGDPCNTNEFNTDTKYFLQSLWEDANADVTIFRLKLEKWFDDTMERTSGWYKKHTQNVLFMIGMLLAISFNVDSITISQKLMKDPKLREQTVQAANTYLEKNNQLGALLKDQELKKNSPELYDSLKNNFDTLNKRANELMDSAKSMISGDIKNVNQMMGLGGWKWEEKWYPQISLQGNGHSLFLVFIGWIITAFAISLGAPFWFDMLNKIMKLRGSGPQIDSATPAGSNSGNQATGTTNANEQPAEEAVG